MQRPAQQWSGLDLQDRAALSRASSRRRGWLLASVLLAAGLALLSLLLGSSTIAPGEVWRALSDPAFDSDAALAVREVRLPRTLLALLVGAAMGAAGALMQGATRNPLADPGLLGVNAGASLMVVVAVSVLSLSVFSQFVWLALAGAALATLLVHLLGSRGPTGGSPVTMTLAGAALTILFTSIAGAILLLDLDAAQIYARWAVGSLEGAETAVLMQVAPLLLAGLGLALVGGRLLNALTLGEEVARALGQRVVATRVVVLTALVLTCGAGTAAIGPVGFVGFVVPHLARRMCGPDYRWVVGLSVPLGAAFLVLADLAGRLVAGDGVIAAGVMTAFLGGPLFVALAQSPRLREL